MGILRRIKKRLPIIGSGSQANPIPSKRVESPRPRPPVTFEEEAEPESPRGDTPPQEFIEELVKSNRLVMFMKGSPLSPACGFSANASAILQGYDVKLTHFDILLDPEVRSGVKTYSDWPTIPQIYLDGEFLGGSDILRQMHESGELKEALDEGAAGGE